MTSCRRSHDTHWGRAGVGSHFAHRQHVKHVGDVGDVVVHRRFGYRGVVFDVDPTFNNTEEWWLSIPADIRPKKEQPYYHLLAENDESIYIAYVSQQNLLVDDSGDPVSHPQVPEMFGDLEDGQYETLDDLKH